MDTEKNNKLPPDETEAQGKTELSKALASRLGGIVLSKDKVRAALFRWPHVFAETSPRGSHSRRAEVNADYRILHLFCPDELALERIRQGQGDHLAADRDQNLYWKVKARFEPIMLVKLDVDTSRSLEESVEQCVVDLKQPRRH